MTLTLARSTVARNGGGGFQQRRHARDHEQRCQLQSRWRIAQDGVRLPSSKVESWDSAPGGGGGIALHQARSLSRQQRSRGTRPNGGGILTWRAATHHCEEYDLEQRSHRPWRRHFQPRWATPSSPLRPGSRSRTHGLGELRRLRRRHRELGRARWGQPYGQEQYGRVEFRPGCGCGIHQEDGFENSNPSSLRTVSWPTPAPPTRRTRGLGATFSLIGDGIGRRPHETPTGTRWARESEQFAH